MKKLALLICVLAILLSLTGVASASRPELGLFTATGYTTLYEYETLPSGHTKFHLTAAGDPEVLGGTGVTGYFEGAFTFDEWGIVDLNPVDPSDPTSWEGSGRGTNHGTMTITANDDSEVVIRFDGQTDFWTSTVWGNFRVLRGSGAYEGLHGQGTYTGIAGLEFAVEFSGRFHTDP